MEARSKRLRYYGLRNAPQIFKNTVKLTATQTATVERLPCKLTDLEVKKTGKLISQQIVKMDEPFVVKIPRSFKNPIANVFSRLCSRIGVKIIKALRPLKKKWNSLFPFLFHDFIRHHPHKL